MIQDLIAGMSINLSFFSHSLTPLYSILPNHSLWVVTGENISEEVIHNQEFESVKSKVQETFMKFFLFFNSPTFVDPILLLLFQQSFNQDVMV